MRRTHLFTVVLGLLFAAGLSLGLASPAAGEDAKPYTPKVAPASDEGLKAIPRIRVAPGLKVDLWAAEPLLANPVAFAFDEKGRCFVVETFRLHAGVTDIRGHRTWLDDDLACRTVADRVAKYKKHLGDRFPTYSVHHDRVRLLEDADGDGRADKAEVFADGFSDAATGLGAGVLARGGKVWFTCIPDLWLLQDTKGTGKADVRRPLQTGYGVHTGFIGHDLHGLCFGPDGKLYFSIGDRGLNVPSPRGPILNQDSGAVLRCNPDGSELEVFATGLRNPQELAFDQYGNLFTGDNNSDGGDKARLVYVVEGGDSGWRIGYQFMDWPNSRGPWNAEKMWHPQWDGQAACIVPPLVNLGDGPSGFAYYPGVGLPDRYREHFFLADFRGGAGQSGIRSFAVKPKGASFEMVDQHEFAWSILATDVDFGPDGALYLSDWVNGWGQTGKGRLYKISDPEQMKKPVVQEVKKLLAEGFAHREPAELAKLLGHPDQRIRQEAQFALAAKGTPGLAALATAAHRAGGPLLARLHGIWGLGQLLPKHGTASQPLLALLVDGDAEVRTQAIKVLGDGRVAEARRPLQELLGHPSPRVRFFAAQSLGKVGTGESVPGLLGLLRDNADQDPYLRHAAALALARINDRAALVAAAKDPSPAVRMGVLLALRRLQSPEVARFLNDAEPRLVVEAARAIYEEPVDAALPQLAALGRRVSLPDPLLHRVLAANYRLGKPEHAAAIATLAGRSDVSATMRVEALRELAAWAKPSGRDRVNGLWRPLESRPEEVAVEALRPALGGILSGPERVRQEGTRLVGRFGIKEVGPALMAQLADARRTAQVRVESLKALESLKDTRLAEATQLALRDAEPRLRNEGRRLLAQQDPEQALASLDKALQNGDPVERQGAFDILADLKGDKADALLAAWLDKLLANQVPVEVQLDLLEAAGQRSATPVKEKLARYEAARPQGALGQYREALAGGNAENGRNLFFNKVELSCVRCHKAEGTGGEVGPDLAGIATRQKRDYLLEALVDPNKEIAKEFETVVVALKDGKILTGVFKSEDAREVKLMTAEGTPLTVAKDQIEERTRGKSAMPEDLMKNLSRGELRDLLEYLAGLK